MSFHDAINDMIMHNINSVLLFLAKQNPYTHVFLVVFYLICRLLALPLSWMVNYAVW